ncbi:MAG: IgGFc-binding protein [Deltaproteobacteria bacterium]|nr:IgGFc-binding protein [Deltaproteobacteria bacterium]
MVRRAWVAAILLWGCGGGAGEGAPDGGPGTDGPPGTDGTARADGGHREMPGSDAARGDLPGEDGLVPCADGDKACLSEALVSVCQDGVFVFSEDCGDGAICQEGACVRPADCMPGRTDGCDGLTARWVCTPGGDAFASQPCIMGEQCVEGECRPVECTPGYGQCLDATTRSVCLPDGSGWGPPEECEPGRVCVGGYCLSACESDIKQNTNVGCQYWAVDLDNDPTHNPAYPNQPTPEMFPHSVVISNPGDADVVMSFSVFMRCPNGDPCEPSVTTCGAVGTVCEAPATGEYELDIGDPVVPGGQSREFKMPVMNVSGSSLTRKAIRVVASLPVVAYQFNPFDSENATSNDGSLLLPQNALGSLYYAVSLPSRGAVMGFPENNGFLAVVPIVPDTTVQVTPTVAVKANPAQGIPQDGTTPASLAAGQTWSFLLQPFQVLNLEQLAEGGILPPGAIPKDLTGTRIEADHPVAVFSGHQVAGIQEAAKQQLTDVWDSCCTEHLEEQLMPVETWGVEALCVKSRPRGYEADRFVIVAGEAGVQLSTDPAVDGVHGETLAQAGDHLRVETTDSFVLQATGKIQVVQFLMSAGQTQPIGGEPTTGDPSMMIIPPSSQYRDAYVIRTADGYGTNWTTVIRPQGVTVAVDGVPIPEAAFEPLGSGTWEFAYHEVTTGVHTVAAPEPFGLMVYGYGGVTAYGYPGGMSLEP